MVVAISHAQIHGDLFGHTACQSLLCSSLKTDIIGLTWVKVQNFQNSEL